MKVVLALFFASCAASGLPEQHFKSELLSHAVLIENGATPICSGVAVSKTQAYTAAHCILAGTLRADNQVIRLVSYPFTDRDVALVQVDHPFEHAVPVKVGLIRTQHMSIVGYGCSGMLHLDLRPLLLLRENYTAGRICPGDSGGGVFNDQDELIALATAYFKDSTGENGAVISWVN